MSSTLHAVETLRPYIERKVIPGAVVAVADRERTLELQAIGSADLAGAPMTVDSVFWIASMTKPMTAAAIMMLVDEGKLDVDAPLEDYIPEFKHQWLLLGGDDDCQLLRRPKNKPRLRHLLGHTGGFGYRSPVEPVAQDVIGLADAVRIHAVTPLVFEPGSKFTYGNAGINTLGRVIEVVSGEAYEDFMQRRLFDPLSMNDTTFWPRGGQLQRLAQAVKPNADNTALEPAPNPYLTSPYDNPRRKPFPGGGIFSVARDVAAFSQMILNAGRVGETQLIQPQTIERFTRQQQGECLDGNYGLCFQMFGENFGHNGAFTTNLTIFPKRGIVTVYLVQLSGALGDAGTALGNFRSAAAERYGTPAA